MISSQGRYNHFDMPPCICFPERPLTSTRKSGKLSGQTSRKTNSSLSPQLCWGERSSGSVTAVEV